MKFKIFSVGLIITTCFMVFAVPYSLEAYLDTSIPFNNALFFIAGVSILLFGITLYYYKNR